jgi:tight adherence protein C
LSDNELLTLSLVFTGIASGVLVVGYALTRSSKSPSADRRPSRNFGFMNGALAGLIPTLASKKKSLQQDLLSAGNYHSTALENFLANRNTIILCVLLTSSLLLASGLVRGLEKELAIGTVALLGYALPRIKLSSASETRKQSLSHAFPDFLDMLSMSIESGTPVEKAIERVSRQFEDSHPCLSREIGIVARQANTGSLDHALQSLGDRVDLPEVTACATTIRQGKRLGVKISTALRDSADRMRDTRQQQAEQAGNLASLKLLLPVVLCLSPPVFILLIGPAVLEFREFIQREKENVSEVVEQAGIQGIPRAEKRSG